MRIIAGILGGRNFDSPRGHRTHPMSEKIRGALFNALGDIKGLTVLDAFAGSGALSFEAISRGAVEATAIEVDKSAYKVLQHNTKQLKLPDKLKTVRANASGWSNNHPNKKFDVVLLDPPHDDLRPDLIQKLSNHLKNGGVMALSWPGKERSLTLENLNKVLEKNYGDAQLVFYRRVK